MGQQQLLLLVLCIVIVGLAVVSGVAVYNEQTRSSSLDRGILTTNSIATDVIAWYRKPKAMGGGSENPSSNPLQSLQLDQLGYTLETEGANAGHYTTSNFRVVLRNTNTTSPYVSIREFQGGVRVDLYLFSPDPECWLPRIMMRNELYGQSSGNTTDTGVPGRPDGCAW